ncbi:retrovirus-related Pol polyprotein from transposon 297 [Trichonephila clavipes]|nr:retrovirus-related Pol polyprotein from transposon 297 [Trichonephila clavipes]
MGCLDDRPRSGRPSTWRNAAETVKDDMETVAGSVNTHNCRIWATENPRSVVETPLHEEKVTVWVGFTTSTVIGPFFFEEMRDSGFVTATVTGELYTDMLQNCIIPCLADKHLLERTIFMQDGAPPHNARRVKELLRRSFGDDRVLSRHFHHAWPPRSPDLSPCDYWLSGYLKSQVYRDRPTSLGMLKDNIRLRCLTITPDMLYSAVHNIITRLQLLLRNDAFKDDPDFVINLLNLSVEDRQAKDEQQLHETNSQLELEKIKLQQIEREIELQKTLAKGQATQQSSKGDTNNLESLIKSGNLGFSHEFSNYQFKVRFGGKKVHSQIVLTSCFGEKRSANVSEFTISLKGGEKKKILAAVCRIETAILLPSKVFEFLKSESEEAGSTNASCKPVCLQNETGGENDVDLTGGVTNSGKITDGFNLFLPKVSETFDECLYDVSHISNSGIRDKVQTLIENYCPNKTETTALKMKIILSDEKPIAQRSRRLSLPEKRQAEKQIDEWLEQGIIREICSDFSSPVVVCKKKDGTMRLCIDCRKLNKKIVKDRYPLPITEEVLDKLGNGKIFITLDLKNAFFHVDVDEASRKYTAFVTETGQYEFLNCHLGCLLAEGAKLELHTDACKLGLGAVLLQQGEDGRFYPLHYMSKKSSIQKEKLCSYELEVLAVIEALKKFRNYLLGRKFRIQTDCAAFEKTLDKKELIPKMARWSIFLTDFDYEVVHRPAKQMQHVDALSRHPVMLVTSDELTYKIVNTQESDEYIRTIKKLLQEGKTSEFIKTFGNPSRVISDKGGTFRSKEFEDYCADEQISNEQITTGVPRGNGQVERIHGVLIPVLTEMSIKDPTKWFKHVDSLQRVLNSVPSRSTKYLPFELIIGVKMKNTEDVIIRNLLEEES